MLVVVATHALALWAGVALACWAVRISMTHDPLWWVDRILAEAKRRATTEGRCASRAPAVGRHSGMVAPTPDPTHAPSGGILQEGAGSPPGPARAHAEGETRF